MAKTSQKNIAPLDINDERQVRLAKLDAIRKAGYNPYPARTAEHSSTTAALSKAGGETVSVAGRLLARRDIGKITFCHLQDEAGKIQLVFHEDKLGAEYQAFLEIIDAGDIIWARGERMATKTGEPSILVQEWKLLAKSIRPLPDKYHGLQDEELRFRKRYLDILLNEDLKAMFRRKALFWQSMRQFLVNEGFLEVETPVLETTAGGADAKPFVTHHDALDIGVYLRISNGELWQKRLMVAGFEKTFEMGRQFRNEGISREHLQDYSQMEFYWAYADYRQGMELVRRMYQYVIEKTYGRLTFSIADFDNVDLSGKWEEIDYVDTIKKRLGIDALKANDVEMKTKLKELGATFDKGDTGGRLIDALWKICRKEIKGPVFLVNLPVAVSPLAKRKEDNPLLTERYQVIIAGTELGNGYSELNDPIDQAERFAEQQRMREAGDDEAQMFDKEFVEALEHGMPPTTGFGVSERLFSFLENRPIRECVLFPLVRPASK